MWKGRFQEPTAELVERLGESVSFDWRLWRHDIAGSLAHARAQVRAGLMSEGELADIERGFGEITREVEAGEFEWQRGLEDVHMNLERALTAKVGAAGAKLHTARSRNDQVAVDTRLWCLEAIGILDGRLADMQRALVLTGRRHEGAVMPGYTHLQRGQPVLFAHHLLAYVEMFSRDRARLAGARERADICPLGSGALAGSTLVLDREAMAEELGFAGVTRNSMDAIADRDYLVELLFAVALCGAHLSRLSEDIILWCSAEFGFVRLSDAHTTGSSLMPQKKNPDVSELTRGKVGRLYGDLVAVLTAIKGLPLTYNRDLQEDKEALFDAVDTLELLLATNAEMVVAMVPDEARMALAAGDPMLLATDLADWLVLRGVPFREAHEIVGKAVAESLASGVALPDLGLGVLCGIWPGFTDEYREVFDLGRALAARRATGAPSPGNVARELGRWEAELGLGG